MRKLPAQFGAVPLWIELFDRVVFVSLIFLVDWGGRERHQLQIRHHRSKRRVISVILILIYFHLQYLISPLRPSETKERNAIDASLSGSVQKMDGQTCMLLLVVASLLLVEGQERLVASLLLVAMPAAPGSVLLPYCRHAPHQANLVPAVPFSPAR